MLPWLTSHLLFVLPLLLIVLTLLFVSQYLFDRILGIRFKRDLLERRNPAVGILLASFMIGSSIGLEGLFFGRHDEPNIDAILRLLAEGILVIPLMFASIWINDRLILLNFEILREVKEEQNLGIAFGIAGSCLASGLVIDGVLTGYSQSWIEAFGDIVLYWILSQGLLVTTVWLYQKARPYDFRHILEEADNLSIGIWLCGFLISLGFIARASVIHSGFAPWWQECLVSTCLAMVGVALFLLIQWLFIGVFFHRQEFFNEIELENNFPAACALAGSQVTLALIISAAIQRPWMT